MNDELDATYSPEDNKLRLRSATRLDDDTYARVKAEGFRWAPVQDLFVAPAWTPERADLCTELAGEIGDENTSLADRAEERADRFEGYEANRRHDAETAHDTADQLSERFAGGQPILVGHHSERRARNDKDKIDRAMQRTVKMWETAEYWQQRARGAVRHASYKARPDVVGRRIKGLEADRRKRARELDRLEKYRYMWDRLEVNSSKTGEAPTPGLMLKRADHLANYGPCPHQTWGKLDRGEITPQEARVLFVAMQEPWAATCARWIAHYTLRIGYERALIGSTTPASEDTPKAAPRKSARAKLPLLNIDSEGAAHITKAEYSRINIDYKGTKVSECKTYRYRHAMENAIRGAGSNRWGLVAVFLTDSKTHTAPEAQGVLV